MAGTSSAHTISAISAAIANPGGEHAEGDHDHLERVAADGVAPEDGEREYGSGDDRPGHPPRVLHERH